ncbi:hypothetical protein FOS14_05965 [Skermania sp. ID1734]|uniref:septum site-determining protein Ssd n=1 Tax=Skermania sp. ID1734 TaxID=2597516 RepID=UPI00117C1C59|nr:septum site-determining protein Ssd [Skermania sp. ID1734]TSE00587.1 hypothetical protein FOS14_05965 [Skermania sp. ID1734]
MDNDPTSASALSVISSSVLAEDVRRAAAAADCRLEEPNGRVDRLTWNRSPLIVLDADAAKGCIDAGQPRRPGVVLVCSGPADVSVWQIATSVGATAVLEMPEQEVALVQVLSAAPESSAGDGFAVAVTGGRGGAGSSVFAAALALAADARASRQRILLLDGDRNGGGIDLLLGLEDRPGPRWPGLVLEGGRVTSSALHAVLPRCGRALSVLACARTGSVTQPTPEAAQAVLDAGHVAGDFMVCDVPRHGDKSARAIAEAADLAVIVVPAELRAVAAAQATAAWVREASANAGVVVRGPSPGGLGAQAVAETLRLPMLAAMRPQPGLATALDSGGLRIRTRSPLWRAAERVLDLIESRTTNKAWAA